VVSLEASVFNWRFNHQLQLDNLYQQLQLSEVSYPGYKYEHSCGCECAWKYVTALIISIHWRGKQLLKINILDHDLHQSALPQCNESILTVEMCIHKTVLYQPGFPFLRHATST